MAAGIIQTTTTTTSGETIEQSFLVDDTGTPTTYAVAHHAIKSDGTSDTSIATLNSSLTDGSAHVVVDSAVGLAQGADTSGQTGSLVMAATLKGAASYTTAKTNPLVTDPAGNLLVIGGGGMGVVTKSFGLTGSTTDVALASVSSGSKIVVTQISAVVGANVTDTSLGITIGFGTANTPTTSTTGTTGMVLEGNFAPGGGQQKGNGAGIIAVGGDGEDLRVSLSGDPTTGSVYIQFTYYTVAA